jgi:GT2 family glycosyltransferase/glycosyltransferase involved in cell wall biosynthesis
MFFYLRTLTLIFLMLLITPILALLAAILLFFNLVHFTTRFTRRCAPNEGAPLSGLASIIILNWNGKDLLAQGLPSVVEAVRRDGRPHEILVVDNGSIDGSVDFVQANFPQVGILALPSNLGFAEGNNAGVQAAKHDVVVLLNNDMVADPGFLKPLLEGFGPKTFAVSSQIFLQNSEVRREETGKTTAAFRRGIIDYSHCPLDQKPLSRPYYPAFWAGGGSSAFHRERFLKLGGFQALYSPAYVEDTDLSYQAWKLGWEVLFAPASVVYHRHRTSSNRRFTSQELQILIQRNQFLFIWKNIQDWRLLLSHCVYLPWNSYRLARDFGLAIWKSLLRTAARIPALEIARMSVPLRGLRSDEEIFELFAKPGLFFAQRRAAEGRTQATDSAHSSETRPRVLWMTAYIPHLGHHAGAGRMFQLLKRLSRSYRITLLTFVDYDYEREFLPELEELCEKVVAMRRIPPPRWQLFVYEPFDEFNTLHMRAAMNECLEESDFSVIQLEYTQMACYAQRVYGIPSLLTKHEVDFAACARRARMESNLLKKMRWFYNYLQVLDREIRLQRRVNAAICMTEPDARELRKFCASVPVHVINTGVDLDYFQPPDQPGTHPRLVFVGAFRHLPNVDAMLYFCQEILPLIRTQVPETELVIAGSSPPPPILSLADIPGVQVTGFVPDIRPPMASSSIYVVPLRLGVGIRGKILEAWSMGMAVVATSVACAGLHYEKGKNILVADSADLFASHVVALLKDPARRQRIGAEGRRIVEELYSWEASAAKLDALYQQYMGAALAAHPTGESG